MNETPLSRLSGTYLASLRTHLAQGAQVNLQDAHEIGRVAVSIGLETLDLARIHDQALTRLLVPDDSAARRTALTPQAAAFFTEATTPIEETHRAALEAAADLDQLRATLDARTLDLANATVELQRQVAERSAAETALSRSQKASGKLLKDSRILERQLQEMAHQILSATEEDRAKMSLQLNDEIAQTLLGIRLRIQIIDNEVAAKHANLSLEVAATQRIVADSAIIISRLAHEISIPQER